MCWCVVVRGEVWRRSRPLVAMLLGAVEEADGGELALPDLVGVGAEVVDDEGRAVWAQRTVLNTVHDLASFGAVQIVTRNRRDRVVSVTVLGSAWLAGELLPGPSESFKVLRLAMAELFDVDDPIRLAGVGVDAED